MAISTCLRTMTARVGLFTTQIKTDTSAAPATSRRAIVVRKRLFRHFKPKSLNICPDRLGANIGKVEKNHVSAGFQMSVERLTADFTASGADAIFLFHVPMVRVVENDHLPRQAQDCHHVCKSSLQTLVFLSQR